MAPLSVHASLLVTWTDPIVLGSIAVGATLIATLFVLRRRAGGPSTNQPQQQGTPADPDPGDVDVDPVERARKAREQGDEAGAAASGNLAAGKGRSLAELAAHEEVDDTELISRFVLDANGDRVGETMTIADGEVILKRDGEFFAVAPDAIIEKNGTLLADANIDWDEARKAGKAWEDENLDRMQYDEEGLPVQG